MKKYNIAHLCDGDSNKSVINTLSILNKKSDLTPRTCFHISPQTRYSESTCLVNAYTNNNSHITTCSTHLVNGKKYSEIIYLDSDKSHNIIGIGQRRNSAYYLTQAESKNECFMQRDKNNISRCPTARYDSPTMNSRRRVYPVNQMHGLTKQSGKNLNECPLVFQTMINGRTVRIYRKPNKVKALKLNTLKNKSENLRDYRTVCRPSPPNNVRVYKVIGSRIKEPQKNINQNHYSNKNEGTKIRKTFTLDSELCPWKNDIDS